MTEGREVPKVRPARRLEIRAEDLSAPVEPALAPVPARPAAKPQLPVLSAPQQPLMQNQAALLLSAQMNSKSPGIAVVLSLLLTGAGQWYCGRIGRGLAFLGAQVVAFVLLFFVIGIVLLPLVWVWAAVDANQLAKQHNATLLTQMTGVANGL